MCDEDVCDCDDVDVDSGDVYDDDDVLCLSGVMLVVILQMCFVDV